MKEIEQESSAFKKEAASALISISDLLGDKSGDKSGFLSSIRIYQSIASILSRLYQLLDSFSGITSSVVSGEYSPQISRHIDAIINVLKTQGMLAEVRVINTRYNDAPFFCRYILEASISSDNTDGLTKTGMRGNAFGRDPDEIFSKALGEFLERYFFAIYRKEKLTLSSINSLKNTGRRFIDIKELEIFADEQKEDNHQYYWDNDSQFRWEWVTHYKSKKSYLIPASLVYWNYLCDTTIHEPFIRESNTNGCGGMFTKEGAILSGLYELIQRDAFLRYWLKNNPPPRIDPESVNNDKFQEIYKESKRYGFEIQCLNITSDTPIPTFAVAVIDPTGNAPYLSLGAATLPSPDKALHAALEEAWAVYYSIRNKPVFKLPDTYKPFSDHSIGKDQRLSLWANPSMRRYCKFFTEGKVLKISDSSFHYPSTFSSSQEELNHAIECIEGLGRGYEVYINFVESPILKKAGYCVARVIVPRLVPLYLNENHPPLKAERLGNQTAGSDVFHFNILPHPFP